MIKFPVEALRQVLDYSMPDEERHYEAADKSEKKEHIYRALKALEVWERDNRKRPTVLDEAIEKQAYNLFETIKEYESDTFSASAVKLSTDDALDMARTIIIEDIESRVELDTLDGVMLSEEYDRIHPLCNDCEERKPIQENGLCSDCFYRALKKS